MRAWSPRPGSNRNLPAYKAGARPFELRGHRGGNIVIRLPLRKGRFRFSSLSPFVVRSCVRAVGAASICVRVFRLQVPIAIMRYRLLEPVSGIEPDPPKYETGARPIELRGQVPAVREQLLLSPMQRKAELERSARRRRQVYDFVRPSEEARSFQTRSLNERLSVRLPALGPSWSRTNISIACVTLSGGRTSSNGRNRTFRRWCLPRMGRR